MQDNGPGLPFDTLKRSLDYLVRVSDKAYYVSPSRGQLGNALKCLWATPYVLSGGRSGRIDVETAGRRYEVCVQLDQIAQEPKLTLTAYDALIKTGTRITLHWPEFASYPWERGEGHFYNWTTDAGVEPVSLLRIRRPQPARHLPLSRRWRGRPHARRERSDMAQMAPELAHLATLVYTWPISSTSTAYLSTDRRTDRVRTISRLSQSLMGCQE